MRAAAGAAARQPRSAHLRRAPAARRAVPRRARADVEGRRLHLRRRSSTRRTSRRSRARSACWQSVRALDDYTVEFTLKEPFAAFPGAARRCRRSCRPIRATRCARSPIGTGPYRFVSCRGRQVTLAAFEGYFDGLPNNAGIVLKVVPDDTMRGLELRKGIVDIVVNDLPPDMVHQLETSGALHGARAIPGSTSPTSASTCATRSCKDKRVRHAIGYAINRDAIVNYLRRGLARPAVGPGAAAGVGLRAGRPHLHLRPGARQGAARRGRLPRPGRRRPAAAPAAVAEDLDQRGNAAAVHRDPAGPAARRHRSRRAVVRVRHASTPTC